MATVTYKNQPAINRTGAHVPLAGDSHLYTVTKMLWPDAVSHVLWRLLIPRSLHVCAGMSPLGDVRLDKYAERVDVRADAAALPFADDAFESVLCDPPYNGEFQWNHDLLDELARVASQRIIFQHWFIPATPDGRYKKAQEKFALSELYCWQSQTYFGRAQLISVFDRTEVVQRGLFSTQREDDCKITTEEKHGALGFGEPESSSPPNSISSQSAAAEEIALLAHPGDEAAQYVLDYAAIISRHFPCLDVTEEYKAGMRDGQAVGYMARDAEQAAAITTLVEAARKAEEWFSSQAVPSQTADEVLSGLDVALAPFEKEDKPWVHSQ